MVSKVRVKKTQLDYFRRMARNGSPLEVHAYLVGEVVSPSLTVVDSIVYPPHHIYHTQTSDEVCWYLYDQEIVKQSAEERGKRIVGYIHSHPNADAVMSTTDYRTLIEDGQRVCGICSVVGRKTRVRFWIGESALPAAIEYAEKKDKV